MSVWLQFVLQFLMTDIVILRGYGIGSEGSTCACSLKPHASRRATAAFFFDLSKACEKLLKFFFGAYFPTSEDFQVQDLFITSTIVGC